MTPLPSTGPRRKATHLLIASLVAAGTLLAACSSSSTPSTTTVPPGGKLSASNAAFIAADLKAPSGSLTAAGSTFVQPFFTKAFYTYTGLNSGLQVNYSGVGSGTGITDFESGSVDFAASDVPMSSSDLAKMPASAGKVIQIPDILGGVSISYNLPGVTKRLRLDAPTLAGIFDGSIKTWNAPQIEALNPGVTLPSNSIVPEVRADSSGTTYIFTDYLAVAAPTRVEAGYQQDHRLAVGGHRDAQELGCGIEHQVDPVLDRLRRAGLRPAEQLHLRGRQERRRGVRGALRRPLWPPTPTRGSASPRPTSPSSTSRVRPATRSPVTAGPSCLQHQKSATTGAQVVKVLDWTTHTGGGQDQASGLGYVVLPPGLQNSNRTALLTVTGPSGQALLTK